jgi:hypothetical protein
MIMSRVSNSQKFIIIAIRTIFSGNIIEVTEKLRKQAVQISVLSIGAIFIATSVFVSCIHSTKTPKITETPTRGDIRMLVDESFEPIIDAEINAFTTFTRMRKSNLFTFLKLM